MFGSKNLETVNQEKPYLPEFMWLNSQIEHLGSTCVMDLLGDEWSLKLDVEGWLKEERVSGDNFV